MSELHSQIWWIELKLTQEQRIAQYRPRLKADAPIPAAPPAMLSFAFRAVFLVRGRAFFWDEIIRQPEDGLWD